MPTKQKWVVRVINPVRHDGRPAKDALPGLWVEQLRRLGVLNVIKSYDGKEEHEVLDFLPPHGCDTMAWAKLNAERMQSFGINAAAAPEWKSAESLRDREIRDWTPGL